MNLQTLISYKEFCFLGRTRAATNGPDESRRAQQGVARRFLARGWVQCTNRCPPEAGFSQSRRASPEAHRSRPNLPVSRCRFPFAFCRTTAPPALQPIPEACLEYHSSTAFLSLSPASGSGWRVARRRSICMLTSAPLRPCLSHNVLPIPPSFLSLSDGAEPEELLDRATKAWRFEDGPIWQ